MGRSNTGRQYLGYPPRLLRLATETAGLTLLVVGCGLFAHSKALGIPAVLVGVRLLQPQHPLTVHVVDRLINSLGRMAVRRRSGPNPQDLRYINYVTRAQGLRDALWTEQRSSQDGCQQRHREEWPDLWAAIDDLIELVDQDSPPVGGEGRRPI